MILPFVYNLKKEKKIDISEGKIQLCMRTNTFEPRLSCRHGEIMTDVEDQSGLRSSSLQICGNRRLINFLWPSTPSTRESSVHPHRPKIQLFIFFPLCLEEAKRSAWCLGSRFMIMMQLSFDASLSPLN